MDNVTMIRVIAGLIALAVCLPLYFLPTILGRKKRNAVAIFAVNFLLGWSFIGWVVALVWSLSAESQPVQVLVQGASVSTPTPQLCAKCGNYSMAGPLN